MTEEAQALQTEAAPVVETDQSAAPTVDGISTQQVEKEEAKETPERTYSKEEFDERTTKQRLYYERKAKRESQEVERRVRAEVENEYLRKQVETRAQQPQPSNGEPSPADFQDYESYIAALTDYKVEVKLRGLQAETQAAREARQRAEHEGSVLQKIRSAAEKYDDFEEIVFQNQSLAISEVMRDAIADTSIPGDVAYYLGTNPAEAAAIYQMSPIQQVKAIDRLEAKLKDSPVKKTTDAPAPIVPNAGKAKVEKDPSAMSDKEFADWRKKQIAQRGR